MPPVAIVSDTTHYLPRDLARQAEIHEISLYVHWQGRQDRESELPDYDGFYRHLPDASELPTTSQPSVGDFLAVYEPLLADGRDVVSIHLAGGISGTCESAVRARGQLDEQGGAGAGRVTVIDSETACGGLGLMLLAAAAAAAAGAGVDDVVARARQAQEASQTRFAVETLEYLRRGGRIGAAQAWLGSALKVKPILTIRSEITPVERVRTSRRAQERLLDFLADRLEGGCDRWALQHIQAPDVAAALAARGRERLGSDPLFVAEVGPVIGTHVGPGFLGVSAIPSRLLAA